MTRRAPSAGLGHHMSGVYKPLYPIRAIAARGAVVTAEDGVEYLDFTTGAGVANTGHCHPLVVAAVQEQIANMILAPPGVFVHKKTLELSDELAARMPRGVERLFFTNSGAESLEAAVKVARRATGRPNIVVFEGGFHGRTAQALAMSSSKAFLREGYSPLPSGIHVTPFPDWFHTGETPEDSSQRCLDSLRRMLSLQSAACDTAAVVVEPIQGEGGYIVPPAGFLRGVEEICREHGILLVCDEVQSGVGRTGRFLALEHDRLNPDIVCMAKGLGSGVPIGAVAIRHEVDANWPAFSHGSTFGGSPVAAAAALATLSVIDQEDLLTNAARRGKQLRAGLRRVADSVAGVGDVRGVGLMNAVEFLDTNGAPDTARAATTIQRCFEDSRILLLSAGANSNIIRFIPPLNVSEDQVDRVIDALANALDDAPDNASRQMEQRIA